MTNLGSAREWAAKKGLAKPPPARGKFSNACREALAKAIESGDTFSDYPTATSAKVVITTTSKDGHTPVVKTVVEDKFPPYRFANELPYPEDMYFAHATDGITKFSMREACQNCGVSLVDNRCEFPVVLGIPVTIERKP